VGIFCTIFTSSVLSASTSPSSSLPIRESAASAQYVDPPGERNESKQFHLECKKIFASTVGLLAWPLRNAHVVAVRVTHKLQSTLDVDARPVVDDVGNDASTVEETHVVLAPAVDGRVAAVRSLQVLERGNDRSLVHTREVVAEDYEDSECSEGHGDVAKVQMDRLVAALIGSVRCILRRVIFVRVCMILASQEGSPAEASGKLAVLCVNIE